MALQVAQILLVISAFDRKIHYREICSEMLNKINVEHLSMVAYVDSTKGTEPPELKPVSQKSAFHYYFSKACYHERFDYEKTLKYCQLGMDFIGKNYGQEKPTYRHLLAKSMVATIHRAENDSLIRQYIDACDFGTNNYYNG